MFIAKGNTYNSKDDLKKIGFSWNSDEKRWEAESVDTEAWEKKYCSASWNGRKQARLNNEANITFVSE